MTDEMPDHIFYGMQLALAHVAFSVRSGLVDRAAFSRYLDECLDNPQLPDDLQATARMLRDEIAALEQRTIALPELLAPAEISFQQQRTGEVLVSCPLGTFGPYPSPEEALVQALRQVWAMIRRDGIAI